MAPSAEQIIAGVVLSERLAVTMYGAVHRAQHNGQRNLRGLVVDPKMLAEHGFRIALTDTRGIETAIELDHPSIVQTAAVESEGPNVVVVTRGNGRFVTVQDLLADARVRPGQAGKLPLPIAALIGKTVVEALAAAHRVGVVHGAVHPRSVLIDEEGNVRLGDFVVGRALTSAVAAGADSSLWRGLAGFLSPELVVGEDPTPAADVFAVGAMLFQMLSGEIPPGSLNITPAVERLVQRALDTDSVRRYKTAAELLDNLVEAFEDDRWEIATRTELVKFAGLGRTDTNLDDATEDLLASLGGAVQAPTRPSMDMRAQRVAARHDKAPKTDGRLDALLADLDEPHELTQVEDIAFMQRDPVSELISLDPHKHAALLRGNRDTLDGRDSRDLPGVGDAGDTLDGRDTFGREEPTPLPAPARDSDAELPRARSKDEAAALDAITALGLGGDTGEDDAHHASSRRARSVAGGNDGDAGFAAVVASEAAAAAEAAALRAEAAAERIAQSEQRPATNTGEVIAEAPGKAKAGAAAKAATRKSGAASSITSDDTPPPRTPPRAAPADIVPDYSTAPPRLKSRAFGIVSVIVLIAAAAGFVYIYKQQDSKSAEHDEQAAEAQRKADELSKQLRDALPDPGTIEVTSKPAQAGVWLKLGRTPLDSLPLSSNQLHELRVELDGYQAIDTQVVAANWSGHEAVYAPDADKNAPPKEPSTHQANIVIPLKPVGHDPKTGKSTAVTLPAMPPKPPDATGFVPGRGPIHVDSTPPGAEVWMYVGMTNDVHLAGIQAGLGYELRVLAAGYLPGYVSIAPDDWRAKKGSTEPINVAKKLDTITRNVELVPDPAADSKDGKDKPGKGKPGK